MICHISALGQGEKIEYKKSSRVSKYNTSTTKCSSVLLTINLNLHNNFNMFDMKTFDEQAHIFYTRFCNWLQTHTNHLIKDISILTLYIEIGLKESGVTAYYKYNDIHMYSKIIQTCKKI